MSHSDKRPRSQSPNRSKKSSKGGFKWKDKKAPVGDDPADGQSKNDDYSSVKSTELKNEERRRLTKYDTDRKYRQRDGDTKTSERGRSRSQSPVKPEDEKDIKVDDSQTTQVLDEKKRESIVAEQDVADKFNMKSKFYNYVPRTTKPVSSTPSIPSTTNRGIPKVETDASTVVSQPSYALPTFAEPMIIVHINDRLGTKAAIPCLASDPVKAFKALVAARIGRKPHEIMLKRQGERPFKDQLTLADYGVSNGVQLDLELDTGD